MIGAYDPIIAEAARRYGVPEERIRAVMGVESGGRARAVSPKGAAGLMQIMPDTYREVAQENNLGPDRFDPRNNIMAGTAYMRQMYDQFGNWDEAHAAYNMGPGRAMQVRNGTATVPAETAAYGPKVKAALATFGQGNQPGGADVPLFGSNRAPTDDDTARWSNSAFGGLLGVGPENNFYDGLGGLLNTGQTQSQPPRTDPAAMPGTTQTDRMDVSGRINAMLEQYLQRPEKALPSQLQYMLAGAQRGVQGLAGVHDRRVGIGEMLGALGGGVNAGAMAGDEASLAQQGGELAKLLKVGEYQNQQRTAALNEQNSVYDNQYKQALTRKALARESDPKVVGKGVYVDGQWIQAPWANGADGGGPLEGTGFDAQMTNVYVTLSQKQKSGQALTGQEAQMLQLAERHLMKPRLMPGPDGVVREVAPLPLPGAGDAGGAPPPAPVAVPDQSTAAVSGQPPAPVPAPAPAATGSRVTEIVPPKPKEIPATAQTAMLGNVDSLRKVTSAIDEVEKEPWATGNTAGILNYLPGDTLNTLLPGAKARAALGDIGSMIIHDRSGAAVTISEFPRLKPFVPQVSDSQETVKMKLGKLKTELEDILRDQSATYSADQSYRENPVVRDVLKAIPPRAPMSGGEGTDPAQRALRSKYGLE